MTPYHDLLSSFGVDFARARQDLPVPGSPERCLRRQVVEDASGALWLLERIGPAQAARREALGRLLEALEARGLDRLAPYRRVPGGGHVLRDWAGLWQLSPFVTGREPERPGYLERPGPARELARWLARLRRASLGLALPGGLFALDLPEYARALSARLAQHRPGVHARLGPVLKALSPYLEAWPGLPRALAHGDLHPLNVVWGADGPLGVIDWEFAGARPALDDAANCLGCVLLEARGDRSAPFVEAFARELRGSDLLELSLAPWLDAAVLASRLGWLSEWLRKADAPMLSDELDYMDHLAARMVAAP
ncbi:hypothetical protein NNJEOMEG_00863 [Fundidesulfovibrio magnetotacticus]|uniref:Aminoglycoside phosphotransferase domain-containing protein n=1 Tax=Fundidesulfovibrio magnetotacticus TaxID=2730080 RepID=A0A6V8LMZ3_9BACT|nr:phosphotransferase [Fundidesulfovibrio magnetotacticus]GFK93034.1 hypothetical protein NNJEOMEG_00863 [Fundidesulfovibrio magnetotacticus]